MYSKTFSSVFNNKYDDKSIVDLEVVTSQRVSIEFVFTYKFNTKLNLFYKYSRTCFKRYSEDIYEIFFFRMSFCLMEAVKYLTLCK